MSDFGFDAYALDEVDTAAQAHPLEIARDLIANGKSRAALEMLSEHHEALADDAEYLLLCSEAWLAEGDELRAQQALLGAARLAPEDPRPLLWLGELLQERGEHEKSERMLAKARALQARPSWTEVSDLGDGSETEEDLIAFAERQERRAQALFTPRQLFLGLLGLGVVALIVGGIAFVTSPPRKAASPPRGSAPNGVEEHREVFNTVDEEPAVTEVFEATSPAEPSLPEELPVTEPAAVLEAEPAPVADSPAATAKAATPVAKRAARKASPSRRKPSEVAPSTMEPRADIVQTELSSMNPQQLTDRADKLYAEGHTGIAASYYRRALELDPDYAPALVGVGQGILRAKKYPEAMMNATRALHLARGVDARPGLEAVAIYQMARVHYERGERDAARRLFRQSISLPGTPSEAWFYLGEALSSDNSPAAREAYERYLGLVPKGHLADRARRAIQ